MTGCWCLPMQAELDGAAYAIRTDYRDILELLRWLEARISLRPLIWCGRHSMFLMATHLPWQLAPELVMLGKRFYLAQTPPAPYLLMMLAEFAVLMLIEAALVWCKEKVKAAMTGRWGKERPICKAVKYL